MNLKMVERGCIGDERQSNITLLAMASRKAGEVEVTELGREGVGSFQAALTIRQWPGSRCRNDIEDNITSKEVPGSKGEVTCARVGVPVKVDVRNVLGRPACNHTSQRNAHVLDRHLGQVGDC